MSDPTVINMTEAEAEVAAFFGRERMKASGYLDAHKSVQREITERLYQEKLGVLGEMAVAKFLGLDYRFRLNVFHKEPNVGDFDVSTVDSYTKCLIVRNNDVDGRRIVLVACDSGWLRAMRVQGWITPEEARLVGNLRNPGGRRLSWFVHPRHLHGMATLTAGASS